MNNFQRILQCVLLCFFYVVITSDPMFSQTWKLLPDSRVHITGTSNINTFVCESFKAYGFGTMDTNHQVILKAGPMVSGKNQVVLAIPIQTLDCGLRAMNQDMMTTLSAEAYPDIWYELTTVVLLPSESYIQKGWIKARAEGFLTISGYRNPISVDIYIQHQKNGTIKIQAEKSIRMTDYGVTPPSVLFGMIKVNNELILNFDLVAGRATTDEQMVFLHQIMNRMTLRR